MNKIDEAQEKLLDFLVNNKTRKLEVIAALKDKIEIKQKQLYDEDPDNPKLIEVLCQITDLINLCCELATNSL